MEGNIGNYGSTVNRPLIVRRYRNVTVYYSYVSPRYSLDKFGRSGVSYKRALRLPPGGGSIVATIMLDDSPGNSGGIIVDAVPDCREN